MIAIYVAPPLLGANFERVEYFPPKTRVFMRILGVERIKTASRGMKCPFLSSDRNEAIVNRFQNLIDNSSSSIDCIF